MNMRYALVKFSVVFTFFLSLVTTSHATTRLIQFGGTHGFTYFPNPLNVFVGDTIKWVGDFITYPMQSTSVPVGAMSFGPINSGDTFIYIVQVQGDYGFQNTKFASIGMKGSLTASIQHFGLTNDGREFYLGMLYPSYNAIVPSLVFHDFEVFALISSYYSNEIMVSYFDASGKEISAIKYDISAGLSQKLQLNYELMRMDSTSDAPAYKACHIKSKYPITVYYVSLGACAGGSYLALPVLGLGRNYVVASYNDNPGNGASYEPSGAADYIPQSFEYAGGEFLVIATEDLTNIKITPRVTTVTGHPGVTNGIPHPYNIQLNKGQCYLVRSNGRNEDNDISGSLIEASRPISVISGHENAFLGGTDPYAMEGRDLMIEQMIPVEYWDSSGYIAVPLAEATPPGTAGQGDGFRIYCYDSTLVKAHLDVQGIIGGYDMTTTRLSSPPEKLDVTAPVEAYSLNGKKISLMQYDERSVPPKSPWPAPSMMTIIPQSRWKSSYFFLTFDPKQSSIQYKASNVFYLNIIGENIADINVSLNGAPSKPLSSYSRVGGFSGISSHFPNLKSAQYKFSSLGFGTPSYYLSSSNPFSMYFYGMHAFCPDGGALGNLRDKSNLQYMSEFASPAGTQLNTGVTPSFSIDTASTCSGWHICVRDTGKNDPGLKAVILIDDPYAIYWQQLGARFSNVTFDSLSDDYFDGELHPHVHGPDSYCFDVNFGSPLAAASAPLAIVDNLGNAVILRLDRSASALKLSTTPPTSSRADSIVFPVKKIGEQICTTFVFKNTAPKAGTALNLTAAQLTNKDTSYKIISITPQLPHSLAPQDSLLVQVCYTPQDSLRHRDSLVMRTDCFSIAISLDAHGSTGLISAEDQDFGTINAGDTLCKNVQVKNVGSASFTLTGFVLSDTVNYSINSSSLPVQLKPGNVASMSICFHPKVEGAYSAGIDWMTDLEASFAHSIKSHSALTGTANPKLGVASSSQSNSFTIHPNPAQDEIEIDLESAIKQDANIEIRNTLGACVYSGAKNLTSGPNSIHLNTKGLASGMYLVRVGKVSQSLVISR